MGARDPIVQELTDKAAIRDLAYTYSKAVDRRDWTLLASCFTPDLTFVLAGQVYASSRDQFLWTVQGIARYHTTMHFNGNHLSEVRGDTAAAETYTIASHWYTKDGREHEYVMGIRYRDELVRRDPPQAGWLFKRRDLAVDWTRGEGLQNPRRS